MVETIMPIGQVGKAFLVILLVKSIGYAAAMLLRPTCNPVAFLLYFRCNSVATSIGGSVLPFPILSLLPPPSASSSSSSAHRDRNKSASEGLGGGEQGTHEEREDGGSWKAATGANAGRGMGGVLEKNCKV
jgi:hypothetical protein